MHVELMGVVAVVVVPVAGDDSDDACAARPGNAGDLEEILLAILALQIGQHPGRLRQADDQVVLGAHLLGHAYEIVDLRGVEILRELDVGAPDPPIVREAQGPVAAMLLALPAADDVALGVG